MRKIPSWIVGIASMILVVGSKVMRFRRAAVVGVVLTAGLGHISGALSAEEIGKVSQPLVAGTELSPREQREHALVGVESSIGECSGTLLNSEWVLSAAHCFKGGPGKPNSTAAAVQITAQWETKQKRQGRELYLLDNDVAIVRVDRPFDSVDANFNMAIYTGNVANSRTITGYGKGISKLATGSGDTAMPVFDDGKYRSVELQVTRTEDGLFWFGPGNRGGMVAGGDSGGPAFVNAGGQDYLAGVASDCSTFDVPNKSRDKKDPWKWVGAVKECGYAKLTNAWPEIERRIGTPFCRGYAWRAIGSVKYAKDANCSASILATSRFSPNFDDHLGNCKNLPQKDVMAAEAERFRISQECRIAAGMPQGKVTLRVDQPGEGFELSGGGYAENTRVIIRARDSAGVQNNISSNRSDANGNFRAIVPSSSVCTANGKITFTAEDQDKPASPPMIAYCGYEESAKAYKAMRADEMQVTGKTDAECALSYQRCELRVRQLVGSLQAVNMIASECTPFFQQCRANAAVAAAGANRAARPPSGTPTTEGAARKSTSASVIKSVDVFDAPGGKGKRIGILQIGERVTLVGDCEGGWCHVIGRNVPGREGYAYSADDYRSLSVNK